MKENDLHHPGRTLRRRGARLIAALIVSGLVCSLRISAQTPNNHLPKEDARNTRVITTDTHLPLPAFTSLHAWEQRKKDLRLQILVAAGLSPMPAKTPLKAHVFGKISGNGYTIEKVLIETLPGFYLGGNLYRPLNGKTRHPAILNPHGHWPYGRLENQPLYSGPSFGISLARQGYIVFAYDMVGYTDTIQIPHHFGSAEQRLWSFGPLGLQLWDSIRALDFVALLDDVDTTRLGIAGASGGGTQAFLLAAIDDRLQFASPVNMVSAIMQGGDLCENAPGLRVNTSNVEIAAMFAPKPMLLVSATGDWTHNVPKEEFPAIQRIYALYGKADQVEVVQIDEKHNFNQLSREAVYRFFAKQNPGRSDRRELAEHDISVPMLQEMSALSNRTLPPNALDLSGVFHLWQSRAEIQNGEPSDRELLRARIRQTLDIEIPKDVLSEADGSRILFGRPEEGDRIPAVWIQGHGNTAIVIDPLGADKALRSSTVQNLRSGGRPILILDLFQTGSAKAPRAGDPANAPVPAPAGDADDEGQADAAAGYPKFLTFNVSADAARVQDIVTAIAYASRSSTNIDIFASGDAALWTTFAAAVSPVRVSLHLSNVPRLQSNEDYLNHFNVPGILRAGGIAAATKLIEEP
jgi:dienelactone hydrolase